MFVNPIPKSEIRNPKSAITLTEVLVSMGVLTVGLLGVAALFPVGGHFMRTGEVADRASAVAQAAFAEVVARDMLNPDNWMTQSQFPGENIAPFGARFRPSLRRAFRHPQVTQMGTLGGSMQQLNQTFGSIYFIDPLGISRVLAASQRNNFSANQQRFLASQIAKAPVEPDNDYDSVAWSPWKSSWPVRRLSLAMPSPQSTGGVLPMSSNLADAIFYGRDDLAEEFDRANDQAARQLWQTNADGVSLTRQSRGNFSWIVTVAPADAAARDALAFDDGGNYYYNVSVVVFHKRGLFDLVNSSESEKLMRARVISKSLSGGELLLEKTPNPSQSNLADLFTDLKPGQWVMLCGPSPLTTFDNSKFVMHWYRVLSVEGEDEQLLPDGTSAGRQSDPLNPRRLVALRGPAWPWEPPQTPSENEISNDLRVAIFPGAVAVHTRTMQLGGKSTWSVD